MSTPEFAQEYAADLNLWLGRPGLRGYEANQQFIRLTDAIRLVQDRVAASRPSVEIAARAADWLEKVACKLADFEVGEPEQVAARLLDEPGRGQTLVPPFHVDTWDESQVCGRVRFTRFHLGSNGAAHGGAISLLFDDLLGQLANAPGRPRARTAYIRVDYRQITPLDRDVSVAARTTSRQGRKLMIIGEICDGRTVLAVAEGLFIQLRSGQP